MKKEIYTFYAKDSQIKLAFRHTKNIIGPSIFVKTPFGKAKIMQMKSKYEWCVIAKNLGCYLWIRNKIYSQAKKDFIDLCG